MEKILKQAIEVHGEDHQRLLLIEELAELIKEMCKKVRHKGDTQHLAEEIADVKIMLKQAFMLQNKKIGKYKIEDHGLDFLLIYAGSMMLDYAIDEAYSENQIERMNTLIEKISTENHIETEVDTWEIKKLERLKDRMKEGGIYD